MLLPGCLDYHLALWGGSATGIVQPLNPLLTDEKLASLMTVARAKVLIAYGKTTGNDADTDIWQKALRLSFHGRVDFRQLDVNDIIQFMLRVIGDADGAFIASDADPFVGFSVKEVGRDVHLDVGGWE